MTTMNYIESELIGLDRKYLAAFMAQTQRERINFHSVIMARGNNIFFEKYWAPFSAEKKHRMYSITKSFVSIAIGCLVDEHKLKLDDKIVDFFSDKLPEKIDPLLRQQTIRDMLTMRTCFLGKGWFQPEITDRVAFYFSQKVDKVPGTIFDYDSNGSYILGVLVERLSGMGLLDYLKKKVLNKLGGFEDAQILMTPDGTAWGDSAMICTPRALLNFARFVMNLGSWNGEQLLSADYLREATRSQTDNNLTDGASFCSYGYGYQIWMGRDNSFFFYGMGGQFAICVPEKDLIFVCTSDVQLTPELDKNAIHRAFFDCIVSHIDGAKEAEADFDLDRPLSLSIARGEVSSPTQSKVNDIVYQCRPNPMGISQFRLHIQGEDGLMEYTNAQGAKQLHFGMKKNVFSKFPQLGYSNEYGNIPTTDGFRYDCAASAGWLSEKMLQIRVQIIDKYFGILVITVDFKPPELVSVAMSKRAENFLDEYQGVLIGECSPLEPPSGTEECI